jgi:act minimal PKS ketosynthase (KS/KS alpha)
MRRAVITGIGMAAPGGVGRKEFWEFITSGESATRPISLFDATEYRSRIAAEVDWDPAERGFSPLETDKFDRMVQFALVCLREAWLVDHTQAAPWIFDYFVPTSFAREVAWAAGAEGPSTVISTGCTSGMDAVGYALELIRDGSADVMVTGASDAPISPITVACFDAIKATSPSNDDAARACRPFDLHRNGFVLGEGASIIILEEYEHARKRGAHIYAELAGFATKSNAYHMTGLRADGHEMAEAIRVSLAQSRTNPEQFGYVSAHGSGTKQNDLHETTAVKKVFGQAAYGVPMSSIKSAIGHALGSVGAIELSTSALAIDNNVVPPTANLYVQDPECDLDYVPRTAREHTVDVALSVASGFGGFQSAAVLKGPRSWDK